MIFSPSARRLATTVLLAGTATLAACSSVHLIAVDPGHFHASLVQKTMVPGVDPVVHVYAPGGDSADDLNEHLKRIDSFNTRAVNPTHWKEVVYSGPDFFERMLNEKPGNVVVLAGNNAKKTDYILRCVEAGLNVLGDKPMVIRPSEMPKLELAFQIAQAKHVLLYDIMTERYEIWTELQRELMHMPALFGELQKGTPGAPAIAMESVHYFSKTVAGSALKRPAWFFDVRQEGEGLQDVGTHLVDLVQWEAFPDQVLNPSDADVESSRHWATPLSPEQFKQVTGMDDFPQFLQPDVKAGTLQVFANGEVDYRLRGIEVQVTTRWDFASTTGSGDTHHSSFRGTKAQLLINQGPAENYKPALYAIDAAVPPQPAEFEARLKAAIAVLQPKYPGVGYKQQSANTWIITVPAKYDVGHEAHFAQVTENFLKYLKAGHVPEWEVAGMLTKYATLMKAYEMCR